MILQNLQVKIGKKKFLVHPEEAEYNEKVLPIRLKLDVYYVKHASFFGDVKLIVWTVIAILYTACGKYPQWMHDKLVGYAKEV